MTLARLLPRLVTKDSICSYLGEISTATYDKWQARGIVPGPVPGTNRYDVKAHDKALDRCSGLAAMARLSPLEEWEAANEDQA
jgi:hypothetical protein